MALIDFTRPYAIKAASVALFLEATELWDTPVVIPNMQGSTVTPTMSNDEMTIYGSTEHLLSVLMGAELSLDWGGLDNPSYNVMTGLVSTPSGSGASEVEDTPYIGSDNMPYFGLIYALDTDGDNDLHFLFPRVKLDSFAEIAAVAESEFIKPNITAKAARLRLVDGSIYPVLRTKKYAVETAIPTDFNTAFTALP